MYYDWLLLTILAKELNIWNTGQTINYVHTYKQASKQKTKV